jgi:hypothetical protein
MPSSNVSDDPLEETNDSREDEEENGLELRAFLHDDSEEAAAANSSSRSKRNGLLPSALNALVPPSPLVHGQHLQVPQDDDELDDIDDEDGDGSHHHHHTTDGLHAAHGASNAQVAVNIFISFVGAGMLGMPYAFKQSGWFLGGVALSTVSALNVYCMLLLVKSRKYLEQHHNVHDIAGYGDLGRHVIGPHGETFVNICLVVCESMSLRACRGRPSEGAVQIRNSLQSSALIHLRPCLTLFTATYLSPAWFCNSLYHFYFCKHL